MPEGNFAYGDEYTCELGDNDIKTFFVLETNGDDVSLIMNANVDSNGKAITSSDATDKGLVAWITDEDWAKAGRVVTDAMKNDDGACQNGNICLTSEYGPITAKSYLLSSTINWTKLNQSQIKLPTANQILTASGKTFNGSETVSEISTWLIDYLSGTTKVLSGIFGYWTSTPSTFYNYNAWNVMGEGWITGYYDARVSYSDVNGVGPVITVSKSNLS